MTIKLYLENSYLTEYEGKILSNNKIDDKFYTVLDKTIFYPDGLGGQKGDKGTINGIEIIEAYEKDKKIYHVTNEKVPGSEGLIKLDWDNRHHIMQQHTTQHLVSQSFKRLFNIETLSFHASNDFISIDLDVKSLNEEQIVSVEALSNSIVQSNLDVKTYYPKEEEIFKIDFRRDPKVDNNLRVVEIETFDFAACGGTHVRKTSELGLVKIVDSIRQNKITRVTVASGKAALKDYSKKNYITQFLGRDLSANSSNLLEKYDKFKSNQEVLSKNYSNLKNDYLDLLKEKVLLKNNNDKVLVIELEKLSFNEAQNLANRFENNDLILGIYKIDNSIINILIKICGNLDININEIKESIMKKQNFRGGGKNSLLQGVILNPQNLDIEKFLISEFNKLV